MEYWNKSEWKLGLFIAGGIVLFSVLVFTITNLRFFQREYEIRVLFSFANGIEAGAPVRLAGVKIGEVKNVKIVYEAESNKPIVEVDLNIKQDVRIKQGAKVLINTLGLLGEKYVEILPGEGDRPFVKRGDVLVGQDTIPITQLADLGYQMIRKLDKTIDALGDIFTEEEGKENIKTTLKNFRDLSINLNHLVVDTDKLVDNINKGEGTVGKLLYDDTLYNEILALVRDIKRHPWKLLRRPRRDSGNKEGNKGYIYKRSSQGK